MAREYRQGEIVPQSGIYTVTHDPAHADMPHEVTVDDYANDRAQFSRSSTSEVIRRSGVLAIEASGLMLQLAAQRLRSENTMACAMQLPGCLDATAFNVRLEQVTARIVAAAANLTPADKNCLCKVHDTGAVGSPIEACQITADKTEAAFVYLGALQ
jgi:hypothetical protein